LSTVQLAFAPEAGDALLRNGTHAGQFYPADPANPYADYTEKDLYEHIAKIGLALMPDAKFQYSNVGI
jgi:predicted class III extradiol MEMO1 family dioxygenase